MYCNKCGRKINFGEYSYNGECENCHKRFDSNIQHYTTPNNSNNSDTYGCIFGVIIIVIVLFIVMSIANSVKQDSEHRKQEELREFNTQLHQDPSTWNKEQRDRYDSFIKWDASNSY